MKKVGIRIIAVLSLIIIFSSMGVIFYRAFNNGGEITGKAVVLSTCGNSICDSGESISNCPAECYTVYVSNTGNDNNDGSQTNPLATLKAARDKLKFPI